MTSLQIQNTIRKAFPTAWVAASDYDYIIRVGGQEVRLMPVATKINTLAGPRNTRGWSTVTTEDGMDFISDPVCKLETAIQQAVTILASLLMEAPRA